MCVCVCKGTSHKLWYSEELYFFTVRNCVFLQWGIVFFYSEELCFFTVRNCVQHHSDVIWASWRLNTLRPRWNGRHFADDTFKRFFLNKNVCNSLKNSLKFVPKVRVNSIQALVQVMAWRRPGDKPLSEPIMANLLTHICVTQPQWVNSPAIPLSAEQPVQVNNKWYIRAPDYWPFVRGIHRLLESTGYRWIPLTKGQQCGKCFHVMMASRTEVVKLNKSYR